MHVCLHHAVVAGGSGAVLGTESIVVLGHWEVHFPSHGHHFSGCTPRCLRNEGLKLLLECATNVAWSMLSFCDELVDLCLQSHALVPFYECAGSGDSILLIYCYWPVKVSFNIFSFLEDKSLVTG